MRRCATCSHDPTSRVSISAARAADNYFARVVDRIHRIKKKMIHPACILFILSIPVCISFTLNHYQTRGELIEIEADGNSERYSLMHDRKGE
jgi:hypothetical protein